MKLRINSPEPVEVIVEIDDVISLRLKLKQKYSTNKNLQNKTFFLIYKNIVLNIDKILKFYKISDNDEISVRYLENLLQGDERLLEVFLSGLSPSIMYLIVRQNYSINTIKSTIGNIVQNISKIYDINKNEISMESKIEDIDRDNEYYKLIISCDNRSVGGDNQTIERCCDLHDRYLIDLYMMKFPSICRRIDYKVNSKNDLITKIKELKEKINNSNADKFNGILSMFCNPLAKSRFLFVTEMAEYINCCCNDFWNEIFDVSSCPVRDYFLAVLHVCINEYNERNQYIGRDIVIKALNKFENYLETYGSDWLNLMKLFLDCCLIGNYSTQKIEEIFHTNTERVNPSFKIRQNQKSYLIDIPSKCHIIGELKMAVSYQTNVEKKYLYFIRPKSVQTPEDTDEIDINDLDNCLMEIVSGDENINMIKEIAEGGFGTFLLCRNISTNRTFGMKKPLKGDLYQEISNHCIINNCKHVKTYTGLILYEECVCIAMDFMQRGTLISYLEENGHLHEHEISKLSHTLLKQIDEIHGQDLIHRDISGDNIVFDDNGVAVLIDFGISIHCNFLRDENFIRNLFKNLHGAWGYFAPELLECKVFTNKIDIWSFGVVVIEMIYGERVKAKCGLLGDKQRELKKTPKPLSENLIKFCQLCLKKDPNERSSATKLIASKFIREYNNRNKTKCRK